MEKDKCRTKLFFNKTGKILLIMLVIICIFVSIPNFNELISLFNGEIGISLNNKPTNNDGIGINLDNKSDNDKGTIGNGNINIYFYKLGAKNENGLFQNALAEGDSFIIVVGDVEILVDAGTDVGSADAIMDQMRKHVSNDNIWDYIIVTHADKDHIAALGAPTLDQSVFSLFLGGGTPEMELKTLIDFDITQDDTNDYLKKEDLFQTQIYRQYCLYREILVNEYNVNYYTASQCLWEQRGLSKAPIEGLTNVFELDDKGTKLNILDNYYCYNKYNPETQVAASDKNNLCVCFTIDAINNYGKVDRFLFTGDLEEYDSSTPDYSPIYGETKLIERNPQLKEGVVFYKAGHHGSRTSSSKTFVDNIRPQHVVFTGIAGNNSNHHEPNSPNSYPATEVINNIFKYTDRIYIPSVAKYGDSGDKTITDYYGDINVNYVYGQGINVECSKNMDNKTNNPVPIQETEWFTKYRQSQINVFEFSSFVNDSKCSFGNCTLVKYGHYDILIDCGIYTLNNVTQINSTVYLDKIKKLCIDGTIEYLIVGSPNTYSLQQLTTKNNNTNNKTNGILQEFNIENIIDFGKIADPSLGFNRSLYSYYQKEKKSLIAKGTTYYPIDKVVDNDLTVTKDLTIDFLNNDYYGYKNDSDVSFTIKFKNSRFLFLGNNRCKALDSINKYAEMGMNNLDNVVFMRIPANGEIEAYSRELYQTVFEKTTNITLVSGSILNDNFFDRYRFTKDFCDKLIYYKKRHHNMYVSSEAYEVSNKKRYREICGDIQFSAFYQENENINESNITYNVSCSTNNLIPIEDTEYYTSLR